MHVWNLRHVYAALVSLVTVVMLLLGGWRLAWDVAALAVGDPAPPGVAEGPLGERWEWHGRVRRRAIARRLLGDLLAVGAVGWFHVRARRELGHE